MFGFDPRQKFFHSVISELPRQLFDALAEQPELVSLAILGKERLSHITDAIEQQLPDDERLRKQVRALASMLARLLAGQLRQHRGRLELLTKKVSRYAVRSGRAEKQLEVAEGGLQSNRGCVLDSAQRGTEIKAQKATLIAGIRSGLFYALLWFVAAAAFALGDTASVAAVLLMVISEGDVHQIVGNYWVAGGLSLGLATTVELGIRPLMEQSEAGNDPGRQKRQLIGWLLVTAVICGALSGIRVYATGEGGPMDWLQFTLSFAAIPALALFVGRCFRSVLYHVKEVWQKRGDLRRLQDEWNRLDGVLVRAALQEQDHLAVCEKAQRELLAQERAELEALAAREKLLNEIYARVTNRPDVRAMILGIARAAAELERAQRRTVQSQVATLLVAGTLLWGTSGCSDLNHALQGRGARSGVFIYIDGSESLTGRDGFPKQTRKEFAAFLKSSTPGSTFELWTTGSIPGEPRCLFQFSLPRLLPRARGRMIESAERDLESALQQFPVAGVSTSPILEDGYRCGERLSALKLDNRRLVLMSDFLQYSPSMKVRDILMSTSPDTVLNTVTDKYPALTHAPDAVQFFYLPGNGRPDSPADTQRVLEFWRALWTRWKAARVDSTEPEAISQRP
jgi:exonuclease VII large subunit